MARSIRARKTLTETSNSPRQPHTSTKGTSRSPKGTSRAPKGTSGAPKGTSNVPKVERVWSPRSISRYIIKNYKRERPRAAVSCPPVWCSRSQEQSHETSGLAITSKITKESLSSQSYMWLKQYACSCFEGSENSVVQLCSLVHFFLLSM